MVVIADTVADLLQQSGRYRSADIDDFVRHLPSGAHTSHTASFAQSLPGMDLSGALPTETLSSQSVLDGFAGTGGQLKYDGSLLQMFADSMLQATPTPKPKSSFTRAEHTDFLFGSAPASAASGKASKPTSFNAAVEHMQHENHHAVEHANDEFAALREQMQKDGANISKSDKRHMQHALYISILATLMSFTTGLLCLMAAWMETRCGQMLLKSVQEMENEAAMEFRA